MICILVINSISIFWLPIFGYWLVQLVDRGFNFELESAFTGWNWGIGGEFDHFWWKLKWDTSKMAKESYRFGKSSKDFEIATENCERILKESLNAARLCGWKLIGKRKSASSRLEKAQENPKRNWKNRSKILNRCQITKQSKIISKNPQ